MGKIFLKIVFLVSVTGFVLYGIFLYNSSKSALLADALEKRKTSGRALVQKVSENAGAIDAFSSNDPNEHAMVFQKVFSGLQSPELFRIKVYNRESRIIWSNLLEIIGTESSGNEELRDALEGETELELKSVKPEQVTERQYANFTEIYSPVTGRSGEVVGVIEIYQTLEPLNREVNKRVYKIILPRLVSIFVFHIILLTLALFVSKKKRHAALEN